MRLLRWLLRSHRYRALDRLLSPRRQMERRNWTGNVIFDPPAPPYECALPMILLGHVDPKEFAAFLNSYKPLTRSK